MSRSNSITGKSGVIADSDAPKISVSSSSDLSISNNIAATNNDKKKKKKKKKRNSKRAEGTELAVALEGSELANNNDEDDEDGEEKDETSPLSDIASNFIAQATEGQQESISTDAITEKEDDKVAVESIPSVTTTQLPTEVQDESKDVTVETEGSKVATESTDTDTAQPSEVPQESTTQSALVEMGAEVSDAPEAWEAKAAAEKEEENSSASSNNFEKVDDKAATTNEPEKETEDAKVEEADATAQESGKEDDEVKPEPSTSSKKYWLPNSIRRMLGAKDATP